MSDTLRTDTLLIIHDMDPEPKVLINHARALERALNNADARIKRLEEAGDAVMKSLSCGCPHGPSVFHCQTCTNSWEAWRKAKEAKP